MFRKSLFLGLTVMLAVVLVFLVIKGRRQERLQQSAARPVEVVRESPPSLTRVIDPGDLEIVEARMELGTAPPAQQDPETPGGTTATHYIVIRDDGSAAYHDFGLRISYLGKANKVLETRTVKVAELLQPGQARTISDVKVDNVPPKTLKSEVKVAYADLEPLPAKPQPDRVETK